MSIRTLESLCSGCGDLKPVPEGKTLCLDCWKAEKITVPFIGGPMDGKEITPLRYQCKIVCQAFTLYGYTFNQQTERLIHRCMQ